MKKVILCILDGWGMKLGGIGDAISAANSENFDYLMRNYPNSSLQTSGANVGLPDGQMGNSEVGHMTIGAGRVLEQSLVRINNNIDNIKNNEIFIEFVKKMQNKVVHLACLLSDGGVHSHMNHMFSLIRVFDSLGVTLKLHCFSDGRDVHPKSAEKYLNELNQLVNSCKNTQISTISGRYYAMDRDNNIDRTNLAVDTILYGNGRKFIDYADFVSEQYGAGKSDEFFIPAAHENYEGSSVRDSFIMVNFRADRVIQLISRFIEEEGFANIMGMTQYSKDIDMPALFPDIEVVNTIGEVLFNNELSQLRVAETEKYAHVTYFLNCGKEKPFDKESRVIISSPKVPSYDLCPEMSVNKVTDVVIDAIESEKYEAIFVNYANADMVGHTGDFLATRDAIEAVDLQLDRLYKMAKSHNYTLLVTADHGNAEKMMDENGAPFTSHTTGPVPFIAVNIDGNVDLREGGGLIDISPTILDIMGIAKPPEMTGKSLIVR